MLKTLEYIHELGWKSRGPFPSRPTLGISILVTNDKVVIRMDGSHTLWSAHTFLYLFPLKLT
jgi:hypothetical protein